MTAYLRAARSCGPELRRLLRECEHALPGLSPPSARLIRRRYWGKRVRLPPAAVASTSDRRATAARPNRFASAPARRTAGASLSFRRVVRKTEIPVRKCLRKYV